MEKEKVNAQIVEEDISELIAIRRGKLDELVTASKNPYEKVKFDRDAYSKDIKDNFEAYEGKTVTLAGRLMSKRIMGKASFTNLADYKGNIQLYVRKDEVDRKSVV